MINLTDQQIKEIAELLDAGMVCYYNKKTGEIKSVIDFDSNPGADEELWEDDIKELEDNDEDYIHFESYTSRESFEVMADFAENVDNTGLRKKLIYALNNRKPFQNFKWQIDNSGEYRQKWFDFKNNRYIEFVKDQLEAINRSDDEG